MPVLTEDESKRLEGPQGWTCTGCGQQPARVYCNRCDEFYYLCGCRTRESEGHDHGR